MAKKVKKDSTLEALREYKKLVDQKLAEVAKEMKEKKKSCGIIIIESDYSIKTIV